MNEPTDRLTVTLEAQQWNQVLFWLARGPLCDVQGLHQELLKQLQKPKTPNVVPMEAADG